MKEFIFILLLTTAIPLSVFAATVDLSLPDSNTTSSGASNTVTLPRKCSNWKDSERFEISQIDGLKDEYDAGEPIVFFVDGKSYNLIVEKENGFYAAATLGNPSDHDLFGAKVDYDAGKRAWKIEFVAPNNPKQYDISIHLLCGTKESPCATTFGANTWVNIIKQVQVR